MTREGKHTISMADTVSLKYAGAVCRQRYKILTPVLSKIVIVLSDQNFITKDTQFMHFIFHILAPKDVKSSFTFANHLFILLQPSRQAQHITRCYP
jgi:hypothetical protein